MRVVKLLAWLPLPVLYVLGDILYLFVSYVFRYRKKVIEANLNNAFPNATKAEIRKYTLLFYRNLSDVLVEAIASIRISSNEIKKRVTFTNPQLAASYLDKGQTIMVLAGHVCNWEWMLLACGNYFPYPIDAVYKALRNPVSDETMRKVRGKFGSEMIEMNHLVRSIHSRANIIRAIALVADQSPSGLASDYWGKFLGRETCFYSGPAKLALRSHLPVLYIGMKRIKRGHYEVYFEKLTEPPYRGSEDVIGAYIAALEKNIKESPADWLWSHKRWKFSKPASA